MTTAPFNADTVRLPTTMTDDVTFVREPAAGPDKESAHVTIHEPDNASHTALVISHRVGSGPHS